MPPFLQFLIRRLLSIPLTLLVITLILYGSVMLTPPETRAALYLPANTKNLSENYIPMIIARYRLDAPFPVQYGIWIGNLVTGNWGYSPVLKQDVLEGLLERTPATAELTLYSLLFFIPLGLISGVVAARRRGRAADRRFRLLAFSVTSLPPFILALALLAVFYVRLHWFPPERLSLMYSYQVTTPDFRFFTGLLTIDGLLNGRPDIALDAARHLALPVITLSLLHWATLGRVTRAVMIEELPKDYVTAARARGIHENRLVWRHTFRNILAPALTSSTLGAASLITGVYVVEVIYNIRGVSDIIVRSLQDIPDAPAMLGFAIYSVLVVLLLMLALDVLQAVLDPRVRASVVG